MSALSAAVINGQWEIAAYLLLIGLARVAPRVPPETLAELMLRLEHSPVPEMRTGGGPGNGRPHRSER
ncbi:MAG: hypothetical protein FJX77_07880 [Armatimonadetes bacterium]|nr:hypothetical protein [Armatimonadota bacterium]